MKGGNAMGLISEEMKQEHAQAERLSRFGEFVKAQKNEKSPGMSRACLQNEGYRDFYGKLSYETGMHRHMWIFCQENNPKAVVYEDGKEAAAYAEKLEKILREQGYPSSRAWAEQVALCKKARHPFCGFLAPTVTFESADRFIIQMIVK